jgi:hypothetical protein
LKLLAIEKCEGRNRVSFEHVKKEEPKLGLHTLAMFLLVNGSRHG